MVIILIGLGSFQVTVSDVSMFCYEVLSPKVATGRKSQPQEFDHLPESEQAKLMGNHH